MADEPPFTCPTPCDDDCTAPCHEAHDIPRKRTHDVEACERRQRIEPPSISEVDQ